MAMSSSASIAGREGDEQETVRRERHCHVARNARSSARRHRQNTRAGQGRERHRERRGGEREERRKKEDGRRDRERHVIR